MLKIITKVMMAAGPTKPALTEAIKVIHLLWRTNINLGLKLSLNVIFATIEEDPLQIT